MEWIRIRQFLAIGALLLTTSCGGCFFYCYDDTSIQKDYVSDRDSCQSDAERKVSLFSRVTKSAKERNATLLALFADCMHKKNWGVTSPKQEKKKGDKKNDKKDASNFPGIPPATPAIRNDDAQQQEEIRRQQRELSRQKHQQQQQYYQQQEQVRQQQEQLRMQQEQLRQQHQQMRANPPPSREVYRERIIEKQAAPPPPPPPPPPPQQQLQQSSPQIIQREIIREVQPHPQPQSRVIEKYYYRQAPTQRVPRQIIQNRTYQTFNRNQQTTVNRNQTITRSPQRMMLPPQPMRPMRPPVVTYPPLYPVTPPAAPRPYAGYPAPRTFVK